MKKILVPFDSGGYAFAVAGLGEVTGDMRDFSKNPQNYSLVLFTGGEDVCPEMYKDTSPKNICYCNSRRDQIESRLFEIAMDNDIRVTGICRGAQFCNVMSRGKLMHHISGHGKWHDFVPLNDTSNKFRVSSTHHQMIIPPKDGFVIGWSEERLSDVYIGEHDRELSPKEWPEVETEAVFVPRTGFAGVQYHPEYMVADSEGYRWFWNLAKDLIEMSMKEFSQKYVVGEENKDAHNAFPRSHALIGDPA